MSTYRLKAPVIADKDILASLEDERAHVEEKLLEAICIEPPTLNRALRRIIRQGGKRLRPAVCLLSGRLFGPSTTPLIAAAAAIEMLHTATLVHDDLLDEAVTRRGATTLYGADIAPNVIVLAGHHLSAEAARLAAEADDARVMAAFSRALTEVCRGEIAQAESVGRVVTQAEYMDRIYGKTAALFEIAAEAGALIGGAHADQVDALRAYGRAVGMAFQIADDALDFIAAAGTFGKPTGQDLRHGIATLPALLYAEGRPERVERLRRAFSDPDEAPSLIRAIHTSGAVHRAFNRADDHVQGALEALRRLHKHGTEINTLRALARFAAARDF